MVFDRDTFHRTAVQTPSHEDVTAMREVLVETLEGEGHSSTVDEKGNVIATRGTEDGTHLVFNTHIDTVPPHVPYEREGDIVRGRGACDAKGPLAALLDAFLSATVTDGKLTLAISPNEETTHYGGVHLADTLSADGYIIGEPTGLDVCPAARGSFGGEIVVYGESAHASDPDDGVNAVLRANRVLDVLAAYDEHHGPDEHDVLGPATLAITRIESGGPLNQIPAECLIGFDRRPVPPETIDDFLDSLDDYLARQLPADFEFEVRNAYPESPDPDAFATDRESTLVQSLATASGGAIRPFGAATEASYFAANGPTVIFGPGDLADEEGPVAHSEREYVDTTEIAAAARAIREATEELLSA